jgi:hypothetical protein
MAALELEGPRLDICMAIHFSDKSHLDRDRQKECPLSLTPFEKSERRGIFPHIGAEFHLFLG